MHCSPFTLVLQPLGFKENYFLATTLVKLAHIRVHCGNFYPLKYRMLACFVLFFFLRWSLFASVNLYGSGSGLQTSLTKRAHTEHRR